jgi:hypothetical protein
MTRMVVRPLVALLVLCVLSVAACDDPPDDGSLKELPPPSPLSELAESDARPRTILLRTETYVRDGYELFFDRGPDLRVTLPAHTTRDFWVLTDATGVVVELLMRIYEPDGPTLVVAYADGQEAWLQVKTTGRRTDSWAAGPLPPGSQLEAVLATMIDNETTAIAEMIASGAWERTNTSEGTVYQRPGPCNHGRYAVPSVRQLHLAPDESAVLEEACVTQVDGQTVTLESERIRSYSLPAHNWSDILETAGLAD